MATHADLISLQGGAHLLLAVAGYNLARFQLADVPGRTRVRRLLGGVGQVIVPAVVWIAVVALVSGKYSWSTALLVNNAVPGDGRWNEQWQFWFLEAMVWSTVGIAALLAVRPIDRLERRHPWAFATCVLAIALTARLALTGIEAEGVDRYSVAVVFWCIALGWVIARADSVGKRVAVSIAAIVATVGFFGQPEREAVVIAGVLLLVWVPHLRIPRALVPAVRLLAAASLFIYLTHWVVYPAWEQSAPIVGTVLSVAVGVAAWYAYRAARGLVRGRRATQDPDVPVGARSSSG
ncbi:acyltransferase family protein [Agromyces mangrovi Wang et al. 2018]|uniref:acyltransferase family protein n=1 Tax=Agromyces mangrovi TaxID=1858653 RepID=UPI0025722D3B|nr:acyltransferase family protein [Agromyces mangrovi]BDZ63272.1 hypothetical protein GCM10025877_02100 [Agromyces mangrovi]